MSINFGDGIPPGWSPSANGHGSTITTSAPTKPSNDWILHVQDGTAFNNGNWVYANDGTNSIFGQILSGGSSNDLTIDHTTGSTTGTVSSIALGTVVTWRGQQGPTGATGATGPTGPQGPAGSSKVPQVDTQTAITINDTNPHTIHTLSFTLVNTQVVTVLWSIQLNYSNTTGGLSRSIKLDGGSELAGDGANGLDSIYVPNNGQNDSQANFWAQSFTWAAGSHSLVLAVAEAANPGTAIIRFSQATLLFSNT